MTATLLNPATDPTTEARLRFYRAALEERAAAGGDLGTIRRRLAGAQESIGAVRRARIAFAEERAAAERALRRAVQAAVDGEPADWASAAAARALLASADEVEARMDAALRRAEDARAEAEGAELRLLPQARRLLAQVEAHVAEGGPEGVPLGAWADLDRWLGTP